MGASHRRNRNNAKRAERDVADVLGAKRTPLSGGNSRHTRSDVIHPILYPEVKSGATTRPKSVKAIYRFFIKDVVPKANAEKKWPILVFRVKGTRQTCGDAETWTRGWPGTGILEGKFIRLRLGDLPALVPSIATALGYSPPTSTSTGNILKSESRRR